MTPQKLSHPHQTIDGKDFSVHSNSNRSANDNRYAKSLMIRVIWRLLMLSLRGSSLMMWGLTPQINRSFVLQKATIELDY